MKFRSRWNLLYPVTLAIVTVLNFVVPRYATAETAESFKVGVILPLSGSNANVGISVKNGIDLAYEQLPKELHDRVQLVYEDDGLVAARTASALQKLLSVDKVNAVLGFGSGAGNALAPIVEQRQIPFIAIGASDKSFLTGREFPFLHWVTPEAEATLLVDEIVRRGYQRLALVGVQQEGFLAVIAAIKNELARRSTSQLLLLDETFLPDETDYRSFLAKAKSKKVDAVIAGLFPGVLGSFAKQVRTQLGDVPMLGVETFEDEGAVKASGGALIGQSYVSADSGSESYAALYLKRFGTQPGWVSANGYDSLLLLVEAFSKNGVNAKGIAAYLKTVKDFSGAMGRYSASGDHRFSLPAVVKVVTKTGFEIAQR